MRPLFAPIRRLSTSYRTLWGPSSGAESVSPQRRGKIKERNIARGRARTSEWILWIDVKRVPSETAGLARRRASLVAYALSWARLKQPGSDEQQGGTLARKTLPSFSRKVGA